MSATHGVLRRLDCNIDGVTHAQDPPYDDKSFAKIVTGDASPEAGSAAACVPNMRKGWQILLNAGDSESGRKLISDAMRLCPHSSVDSKDDALTLAQWLQDGWGYLAMVMSTSSIYSLVLFSRKCMQRAGTLNHTYAFTG